MYKEKPSLFIGEPQPSQMGQLRALWKEAFGDTDEFFHTFEKTAFSPSRCRCAVLQDRIVAALYWFDCEFMHKPIAYIYGVATAKDFRGQGFCHMLMHETHKHLTKQGYIGALLSPAGESLFDFYNSIGYKTSTYIEEITFREDMLFTFENKHIDIHTIEKEEFFHLRRSFLSSTAVYQENENLDFLETQADFYTGENFLLTAYKNENHLYGMELLGDTSVIPSILHFFECSSGTFRIPGKERPFTMYYPFTEDTAMPTYFGFIFD